MIIPDSLFLPLAEMNGVDVETMKEIMRSDDYLGGLPPREIMKLLVKTNMGKLNPITGECSYLSFGGKRDYYTGPDGYIRHGLRSGVTGMTFTEGKRNEDIYVTCKLSKGEHKYEVSEYLKENRVNNSKAWRDSPIKMLRHRAMQSAIRIACGIPGTPADEMEAIGAVAVPAEPQQMSRAQEALASLNSRATTDAFEQFVLMVGKKDPVQAKTLREECRLQVADGGWYVTATEAVSNLMDLESDAVKAWEEHHGPIVEVLSHSKAPMKIRATGRIEAKRA